jgi:GNAT superfamily N-acetyltransferase
MTVEVRAIEAGEWPLVRDLRLRALADAPDAFASTLDEERSIPEAEWMARVAANVADADVVSLLVRVDGGPAGIVRGRVEDADTIGIAAMWVAPEARRRGAGAALLDALTAWGRSRGARWAVLWVADTNGPARSLYRSAGFRPTGARGTLREGAGIDVIELRADL